MPRSKQAVQEQRAEMENYSTSTPDNEWNPPGYGEAESPVHQEIQDSDWAVGFSDRGDYHSGYAVIVKGPDINYRYGRGPSTKEVVVECSSRAVAEHIVSAHKFLQLHTDEIPCGLHEGWDQRTPQRMQDK